MSAVPFADLRERREASRWTASLLVVLALHAGLILLLARHPVAVEPVGTPPAAVLIDLPPAPPAAPEPATAAEPAAAAEPQPPEPEQPPAAEAELPPTELPRAGPSPAAHPPLALPPPSPKPKPKTRPAARPPPPRLPPAPAAPAVPAPAPPAPPAAAQPTPAAPASSAAAARSTWQAQLLAWLERHKRYPRLAQEQRQQGTALLRFTLDRQGRVLSFALARSSGFALLDDEVLALIGRAQPVPAPPPEIAGERIEIRVPVAFSLRRGGR